jgi:hypothetical protein
MLSEHIEKLNIDFLAPFIPTRPEHTEVDFGNSVKAYCVLSHAAFEEFVENISLLLMSKNIEGWMARKDYYDTTIMLIGGYGINVKIVDDEAKNQDKSFDLLRAAFEEIKQKHSKAIHDNHGFSVSYLRKALTPVFVDVPSDPVLLASLETLADARGSFAHKFSPNAHYLEKKGKARRPVAPEQAQKIILDCLELCRQIANKARLLFYKDFQ